MPDNFIFNGHYVISEFERCQILQNGLYSSRQLGEPLVAVLIFSSWLCCSTLRSSPSSLDGGFLLTVRMSHLSIRRLCFTTTCWWCSRAGVVTWHRVAHRIQQLALLPRIELLTGFSSWRCHLTSSCSPYSAAGVVASHRDTHPAIGSAAPCVLVLLLTWRGRWGIAPSAGSRQQISVCRRSASKRRQWFTATGFIVLPLFCVFLFFFVEFNLCPPPPCKECDTFWWEKVKTLGDFWLLPRCLSGLYSSGCYAAYVGSRMPTFRDSLWVPYSSFKPSRKNSGQQINVLFYMGRCWRWFFVGEVESVRLLEYAVATRAWGSGLRDTRVRWTKWRN